MSSATIQPYLVEFLRNPTTPFQAAVDALEEWILQRRSKGATLFEVSVGIAELEAKKTPPYVCRAFDRARYVTNVPQASDLTPPTGPFPLARSQSVQTILHHLLSKPTPTLQHSREVILEFVLPKETKLRDKKPGRGGKGTLGREGFEEISKRLTEVEDGLRGLSAASPRRAAFARLDGSTEADNTSPSDLDEARTMGLTLILSLRLSLSYFTLQDLATQLLLLATSDAERALVQHIRRRVQGEGRFGVGKELDFLESLTIPQRPSLGPVFRSAKARTHLPAVIRYPVALPAPSKSACIKQLSAFSKDVEGGFLSNAATASSPFGSPTTDPRLRPNTHSPASRAPSLSPKTPLSAVPATPPPWMQNSPIKPPHPDPEPMKHYALELVSEYLTREKREYMLRSKWAKSGRDQLGKDLGDIESALCMCSKTATTPQAPILMPVFLQLRRTFTLPPSPLPSSIVEPFLDLLPAPPDPDEEPFREPTVQTTTVALYQNPRLEDDAAIQVLEEFLDSEKEMVEAAGANESQRVEWCVKQIENVKKRFPDGSYDMVFEAMIERMTNPQIKATSSQSDLQTQSLLSVSAAHRRTRSGSLLPPSAETGTSSTEHTPTPTSGARVSHSRSLSMPMRKSTYMQRKDSSSSSDGSSEEAGVPAMPNKVLVAKRQAPEPIITSLDPADTAQGNLASNAGLAINMSNPKHLSNGSGIHLSSASGAGTSRHNSLDRPHSGGGWWDVVSAVSPQNMAPWHENPRSTTVRRMSRTSSDMPTSPTFGQNLTLPPGAEPPAVQDLSMSYADLIDLGNLSRPSSGSSPMRAEGSIQQSTIRLVDSSSPSRPSLSTSPKSPADSPNRMRLPFASSPQRTGTSPSRIQGFFKPNHSRNSSRSRFTQSVDVEELDDEQDDERKESFAAGLINFSRPTLRNESSSESKASSPSVHQSLGVPNGDVGDPGQKQEFLGTPDMTPGPVANYATPTFARQDHTTPGHSPSRRTPTASTTTPSADTPSSAGSTPTGGLMPGNKPKLFARSMTLTLATRGLKNRDRNKENERDDPSASRTSLGMMTGTSSRKEKISNKPKNWNRDMVADIMGPPAERR
ncbi:hypothetical protein BD324DRAFT_647844 [Kockovaella imperatae]|uniref:Uncharacterized protein n=1 Tax=Kockovaella imperatae TaxID=4999 RepID=A0A1Y1USE3_9TREE|nr:hypothetical protein BD324DRAFT_647844 [Kockovaella imperatae]ORX40941.1 hypothetical protein BD324DRAFT_647844 [Kockovaella imperatae]